MGSSLVTEGDFWGAKQFMPFILQSSLKIFLGWPTFMTEPNIRINKFPENIYVIIDQSTRCWSPPWSSYDKERKVKPTLSPPKFGSPWIPDHLWQREENSPFFNKWLVTMIFFTEDAYNRIFTKTTCMTTYVEQIHF